ncbi:MAG: acetylxylan esterase [Clostridia bacterium]|nr:acetylxylan esterase [Clostridia bacterium]
MNENYAQKAYAAYKKTAKKSFTQVTTAQLNVIYNILCRMKRDEEYRRAIEAFKTEEGDSIEALIEKYFTGYNARHGLDIKENLIEFDNPDLAEGAYFIIETYKKEGDTLTAWEPTEFIKGDVAHVVVSLYSHAEKKALTVPMLKYTSLSDDEVATSGNALNASSIEFDVTLSREGWVKFKVTALDESEKIILGSETAYGGILFSWRDIHPTKMPPSDLVDFWNKEIDRLLNVDPTDTTPDGYVGNVVYEYDMPKENHYELIKFDKSYIDMLREYGICNLGEELLEKFDFYELNLKAPGPCHAATYLTVPKNAIAKSLPIRVTFDGYSAFPPVPEHSTEYIDIHCSHHGYKLPRPLKDYYQVLRTGILENYGRGNGKVNSDYQDLHDNYILYLQLRNLQTLRFVTDPALSGNITGLHESWNGEVAMFGGSMGGFQALTLGALSTLLLKKSAPFKLISISANIPAFCNLAGRTDGRVPTSLTSYEEGMEYFDPVHLVRLINVPVTVPRCGLGDETCPANGIIAMFNTVPVGVKKEIRFLQNSNHGYIPEEDVQKWYKYIID